jgi:hypothetical protein
MNRLLIVSLSIVCISVAAAAQAEKDIVSTREMDRINWMEFKEVVPSKIKRSNRTGW